MRELMPVVKANALAAAGFSVVAAVVTRFFGQNTYVLLAVTVGYVLLMNRWVARVLPPPPAPKPRKGSFKPDKTPPNQKKWEAVRWTLKVAGTGVGVQMLVFTLVWSILALLLQGVR